jgi:hypothetical protein
MHTDVAQLPTIVMKLPNVAMKFPTDVTKLLTVLADDAYHCGLVAY